MSREDARREARRAINALGGISVFAREAGIDAGTVGDFLAGKRWPRHATLNKIEAGLGWHTGRIDDLADGREALPASASQPVRVISVERDDDRAVVVYRDENLLPEAVILAEAMKDMGEERRQEYLALALELSKAYRR